MMTTKHLFSFSAVMMLSGLSWAQTTRPTTQPSPDALLNRMLTPDQSGGKALSPATESTADQSASSAVAPNVPVGTVMREGTYIVDRTGRIKHMSDGQIEFLFDADGKTLRDPPVILLPNLMLMSIQTAAANSSRDLHFRITGMVTEYQGRNYVLLDKVVVVPDVVQPLQ